MFESGIGYSRGSVAAYALRETGISMEPARSGELSPDFRDSDHIKWVVTFADLGNRSF
jgi:hypothetical protein